MAATLIHPQTPTAHQVDAAQANEIAPIVGSSEPTDADRPYMFSADQFDRIVEAQIFPHEARVELWDGRIYERMAKTQAHATSGNKALLAIMRALPDGWFPGPENPVKVDDDKVPLPDLVILRGIPDDYRRRRPQAADIGLIVEVSLTSLRNDLGPKLAGYARAGVPAYWVVDLAGDSVRAFADPGEGLYRSADNLGRGEFLVLHLVGADPIRITVDDILPLPES